MPSPSSRRGLKGFTLVELLVVIAIIGILIALLLPAIQAAREAARRSQCVDNLKQLSLGCLNYNDVMKKLPQCYPGAIDTALTSFGRSWMFAILPYVEQAQLQNLTSYYVPLGPNPPAAGFNANGTVAATVIPAFLCPSSQYGTGLIGTPARSDGGGTQAVTCYKGNAGSNWEWGDAICQFNFPKGGFWAGTGNQQQGLDYGNGIMYRNWESVANQANQWVPIADVRDGTMNTFLIGEAVPNYSQWNWWWWSNSTTGNCGIPLNYKSLAIQANPDTVTLTSQAGVWQNNYGFWSLHPSGANFGMVDGHVTFVTETIDLFLYRMLANRGDEVAVTPP